MSGDLQSSSAIGACDGSLRIVVVSAFRDAAGKQIRRWVDQVGQLSDTLSACSVGRVRAVAVEGDSTDDTAAHLTRLAADRQINFTLHTCHVGGPRYGSVEHPDRMQRLSKVGNAMLDAVLPEDDYAFYVESDLIWSPDVVSALLGKFLFAPHADAISPLTFAGPNHYDVWALRGLDGARFSPFLPYHSSLRGSNITEVSSLGSAILIRGQLARDRRVRMGSGAIVEWSYAARSLGYRLFVAPYIRVDHPA